MSSRASSALLRLKQMDNKYKSSMEKTLEKFSDISGVSSDEKTEKSINSQKLIKAQLNIKLPETYESFSSNSEDEDVKSVKVLDAKFNSSTSVQLVQKINTSGDNEERIIVETSSQSSKTSKVKRDKDSEQSVGDSISEDIQEVIDSIKTSESNGSEEYSDDSFESGSSENEGEDEEESLKERSVVMESGKNDFYDLGSHKSDQEEENLKTEISKSRENLKEKNSISEENKSVSEGKNSGDEEKLSENKIDNSSIKTTSTKNSNKIHTTSNKSESSTSSRKTPPKNLKKHENICFKKNLAKSTKKLKDKKNIYASKLNLEGRKKNLELRESSSKAASEKKEIMVNREKRSLSMIRCLRQIEENRQRLLVWPTNFVCCNISRNAVLKPLETPELFNIIQPVTPTKKAANKNKDPTTEILRSRILNIRQWMSDQYLIYKEQSNLAASIDSNYKPLNLNEAKKTVRQFRQTMRHQQNN